MGAWVKIHLKQCVLSKHPGLRAWSTEHLSSSDSEPQFPHVKCELWARQFLRSLSELTFDGSKNKNIDNPFYLLENSSIWRLWKLGRGGCFSAVPAPRPHASGSPSTRALSLRLGYGHTAGLSQSGPAQSPEELSNVTPPMARTSVFQLHRREGARGVTLMTVPALCTASGKHLHWEVKSLCLWGVVVNRLIASGTWPGVACSGSFFTWRVLQV